jgi:hypothetical protein
MTDVQPTHDRQPRNAFTRCRAATRDGYSNGKEVAEVFDNQVHRSIHNDRIREIRSRSVQAQRRNEARAFHAAQRPAPRSVRRSIGRSIVRMGEAIAAERGQPVASS